MADLAQLERALVKADAAGDVEAAKAFAGEIRRLRAQPATAIKKSGVNANFEAGKAKPAWQQGLVAGSNGLLLGFADEVGGALGAVADKVRNPSSDLSENYTANRDSLRGMEAAQRDRAPWTTAIGQGLSSLPLTMAAPTVAGGLRASSAAPVVAGVGARALQSAAVGAALGTIGGAGNSISTTASGVAGDALRGGLISAALGGASTPVAAAIGGGARNIGARLSGTSAGEYAKQKVAQAIARDGRGVLATSGVTNPLAQVANRFGKLGDEAVLADAGGRNTNQLLDTLATLPGRTKEASYNLLRTRTAGVGNRMRDAAETSLRTGGKRLDATVEDLIEKRSLASAPIYNELRTIDITPSARLAETIAAADKLGATKLGREIATARQQNFTLDPGAQGPQRWNMGDLDYVKQGIDQVLASSKAIGKDGKLTPLGAAYTQLKDTLTRELDSATINPQTGQSLYNQARSAFSEPSKIIDAAKAGKLAISKDESSILGTVKGMSQNELDAFRIGAFEGLRGKLGTQGGQTEVMNMWKNPGMQEKLKAIFGNERSFRKFASDVAKEASLKRLQSVGAGSQTANRLAGMGDLDQGAFNEAASGIASLKTGNILAAVGSAKNAWNRLATPQVVRDQMGQILMSRGPGAQQTLNELSPLVQRINSENLLLSNRLGLLGGNAGNQLNYPINNN